jgi:hypothetical protein
MARRLRTGAQQSLSAIPPITAILPARALLARQFLFYGVYLHIHGELGFIHGNECFEYRLCVYFGRRSSSRAISYALIARPEGTSECGVAL